MSTQGSLFGSNESAAPAPQPQRPKFARKMEEFGGVKNPWGKPDKKGNYFYQKIRKEVEALPSQDQELFHFVTTLPMVRFEALLKAFRLFGNATDFERIDFDVSRGELGESE